MSQAASYTTLHFSPHFNKKKYLVRPLFTLATSPPKKLECVSNWSGRGRGRLSSVQVGPDSIHPQRSKKFFLQDHTRLFPLYRWCNGQRTDFPDWKRWEKIGGHKKRKRSPKVKAAGSFPPFLTGQKGKGRRGSDKLLRELLSSGSSTARTLMWPFTCMRGKKKKERRGHSPPAARGRKKVSLCRGFCRPVFREGGGGMHCVPWRKKGGEEKRFSFFLFPHFFHCRIW